MTDCVCLSLFLFVSLSVLSSVCLSVCLCLSLCLSVCLSIYVTVYRSVSLCVQALQQKGQAIFYATSHKYIYYRGNGPLSFFSDFWLSRFKGVMTALILHSSYATLSRSQFGSDIFSNLWFSLKHPRVYYYKSGKSNVNFPFYKQKTARRTARISGPKRS